MKSSQMTRTLYVVVEAALRSNKLRTIASNRRQASLIAHTASIAFVYPSMSCVVELLLLAKKSIINHGNQFT